MDMAYKPLITRRERNEIWDNARYKVLVDRFRGKPGPSLISYFSEEFDCLLQERFEAEMRDHEEKRAAGLARREELIRQGIIPTPDPLRQAVPDVEAPVPQEGD
jgi:hypothetical protein